MRCFRGPKLQDGLLRLLLPWNNPTKRDSFWGRISAPRDRPYVTFKGGRGFFVIVLVANQKPRFPANHVGSLCTFIIHLISILYASFLYKKYLRKGISALNEGHEMFIIRESPEILKHTTLLLIIETIKISSLIKRILFLNINFLYKNYI